MLENGIESLNEKEKNPRKTYEEIAQKELLQRNNEKYNLKCIYH